MRACWTAARRSLPAHPSQRTLSHKTLGRLPIFQDVHPCVRDFAIELGQTQPCFQVRTQDIQILSQPKEYLELLMVRLWVSFFPLHRFTFAQDMIRRARRQIFLSSLYLGSAELYLVNAIVFNREEDPE